MVEIVLCCRLQFGDGTIAIVLFGWYYSDGNSRFVIDMVEIAHCCRLQLMMVPDTYIVQDPQLLTRKPMRLTASYAKGQLIAHSKTNDRARFLYKSIIKYTVMRKLTIQQHLHCARPAVTYAKADEGDSV
jgi:hypothetical protein